MTALTEWGGEVEVAIGLAREFPGGEWDTSTWDTSEWEQTDTALGDWLDVTCDVLDGIEMKAGTSKVEGVIDRWEAATVSLELAGAEYDPRVGQWAGLLAPGLPVRIRWRPIGGDEWTPVFLGTVSDAGYKWDPQTLTAGLDCDDLTAELVAYNQVAYTVPMGADERAAQRIAHLADLAMLSAEARDITGGGTYLQASSLGGSVWGQMLDVADSDLGLVWLKRNGQLAYRPGGRVREIVDAGAELAGCPIDVEYVYGPNVLTPAQSSFEGALSGWAAPAAPPVNMFSDQLGLFLGPDAASTANLLGMWRVHTTSGRLQRINGSTPAGRAGNVMRMTNTVTSIANLQPSTGQNVGRTWAVKTGDKLTFFASIRASSARPTLALSFNFTDSAGATVASTPVTWAVTTAWQDFRAVITVPANAVAMAPSYNSTANVAVGDWIDFVQTGVFPGDVPAWVPSTGAWTANRMDAERASVETNTIAGGSGSGQVVSGWRAPLSGQLALARAQTHVRDGAWSMRTNSGPSQTIARADPATPPAGRYGYPSTPLAPQTMMASVYPTAPIPANTVVVQVVFFSDAGMTTSAQTVNYITDEAIPANQWYDAVFPVRTTAVAAVVAWPTVQPAGLPNNTDVFFDRVGWFDGHVGTWTHPDTPNPYLTMTLATAVDPLATDGTHVLVLTRTGTPGRVEAYTSTANPATPGGSYSAAVDLALSAGGAAAVALDFLDAAGTVIGSVVEAVSVEPSPLTEVRVTGNAPAGAVSLRLHVSADSVPVNGTLKLDKAAITTRTALPTAVEYANLRHADPLVLRNDVTISRGKPFVAEGTPDPPEPPAAHMRDDPSVARFRPHTYKRTDLLHRDDSWSTSLVGAVIANGAWPTTAPVEAVLDTRVSDDLRIAAVLLGTEAEDVFTIRDALDPTVTWRTVVHGWSVKLSRYSVSGSLYVSDLTGWGAAGEWDDPDTENAGWDVSAWALTGVDPIATTKKEQLWL